MNRAAVSAIRSSLANVEDNLYRYRHMMAPGATTANGETREEVIAKLEAERDELRSALEEVR